MLDLAGLPEYHGMQGTSLGPILDDPTATPVSEVLVEDDLPYDVAARIHRAAKCRTVITDDNVKYTRWSDGTDMLFDLTADPDELDNVVTNTTRRAESVERLADALIDADDQSRFAPMAGAAAGH